MEEAGAEFISEEVQKIIEDVFININWWHYSQSINKVFGLKDS